jgi:hypothetical protein
MIGHISTSRTIMELPFYTDDKAFKLFYHCLIKANFKPRYWKGDLIKRGQFITSISNLADELGWSLQSIRTYVSKLEKYKELTKESTMQYTTITVCNYEVYASCNNETNIPTNILLTNEQQTSNKRVTTREERKKEINNTKNDFFDYSKLLPQDINDAFVRLYGKEEDQVEEIIQQFKTFSCGISLDSTFALMQIAKFKTMNFEKYKYKMHDDRNIEASLFKFLTKGYQYSKNKKTTSLRNQNDYEKYLLDWVISYQGKEDGTFKFNYWKKNKEVDDWTKGYKKNKPNLLSIYKEHFSEYPNLTLFTLYDVLYLNVWNKCSKTPGSIPNTIKEFKGWLKRNSKKNNYKMNKTHMRTNIYDHLDKQRL